MDQENQQLPESATESLLYNKDLAPTPASGRTWNTWHLAALWVGMAVCIPTYLLASYMIRSGLSWQAALVIIGLANAVITIPMVLNGHGGVKYGIPFPVLGRASFGTRGIHVAALLRAIVACGWFGVQTWIGGLAFYSIWNVLTGHEGAIGLDVGKFVCFGLFWLVNIFFIWKGTESIKWLEDFSAPILILIGAVLIYWGYRQTGSFSEVLAQGVQVQHPSAVLQYGATGNPAESGFYVYLNPIKGRGGKDKAVEFTLKIPLKGSNYEALSWILMNKEDPNFMIPAFPGLDTAGMRNGKQPVKLKYRNSEGYESAEIDVQMPAPPKKARIWDYILWFTAMIGFWATMAISIPDITRYARSQRDQIAGQFLGLPGAMIFYSFVGVFVTCAAIIAFNDVMVGEDTPWDPVSLVAKFKSPSAVLFAQIAMVIATLSTNIAANVIAPANAFSNLSPQKISFRTGGVITGLIGIAICPWWLIDEISSILIFISGLLGPVLGILLSDYFLVRKKQLSLVELYLPNGAYSFGGSGINRAAIIALVLGLFTALIGYWVPALVFLYNLSWITGFTVAFVVYYLLMPKK